jgi:hypothetical protein
MSAESKPQLPNAHEHVLNAPNASAGSTPEAGVTPAVAHFRKEFKQESRFEILVGMGEEPREYQQMMESLLEDLQPRLGLESHLVEQMGETFWRMRRAQRMRDGLALKSIRNKVQGEDMVATMQASQAFEAVEPFERLKDALSRRGQGPTAAEIDEFVKTRKGEPSEAMQQFITLLKSLNEPMEEKERKAARREARKQLLLLREPYAILAFQCACRSERVQSAENLAALMAPEDQKSVHLQRLEDSNLRRLWRLINAFGKVRQGVLEKKDVKNIRAKPVCI